MSLVSPLRELRRVDISNTPCIPIKGIEVIEYGGNNINTLSEICPARALVNIRYRSSRNLLNYSVL